jgi:tetratricopeptide (TPR) repeat protein
MKKILLFILIFNLSYTFAQSDFDLFVESKIFEDKGKIDTSIYLISHAISISPEQIYLLHRGQLYFKSKKYNEALNDFILLKDSNNNEIDYKIACCYAALDNFDETDIWLRKYLNLNNKLPSNVIKSEAIFSKFKTTTQWTEIWNKNWYSNYENYISEMCYLYSKGLYSEIFDVVDSALKYFPEKDELWLWRAKAFKFGNNPKEEMISLDKALKINSTRVDILLIRANLLRKDGKSKKAIVDYSSALEIQPWNVKLFKERGISKIESYDYNGAIVDFLKYFSYDINDGSALYYAGHAAFLKGDYKKAIELFTNAIKLESNLVECYFERGRCYLDLLNYETAFTDFCMAIDLKPNNGEIFCFRGLSYFGLKNKLGACHDWQKAKTLEYPKAEEYLLRFCSDLK